MASNFAMSGVFSGIDTDTLVAATMAAARGPINRLESQKSTWQQKISAVDDIERRMGDLRSLVDDIRDEADLRKVEASSSNRDVLEAVATGGAVEGTHEILVNQLASSDRHVHDGVTPTEAWTHDLTVAALDSQLIAAEDISDATGDDYRFVFQFDGEAQVSVDLSAYDATGITLGELIDEINAAAGYTAAGAADTDGQLALRIQAAAAGGGKDLTITDDSSVETLAGTGTFTQTVDGDVGTDAFVGAGQLVFTYDGVTRTITTTEKTTLGQLRDMINNDAENPGVQASILEYEGVSGGRYHLVLTGEDTGADYGITLEAATTLSGFEASTWSQTQTARNAQIRVDGYPQEGWIEKASNTVTDVIPGVTLKLYQADGGSLLSATSSSTDVATVAAGATAEAGSWELQVNQLAAAARQAHDAGLASADTTVGVGDFVYTYDGTTRTITTDATTTLADLRDQINADASNPGVVASVLEYDGTYHLVLDGQDTGSDYDITIEAATTLSGFGAADFAATAARDAQVKVNGYPPGGDWITRGSNTLTDVVPGATVTLTGTGTTSITLAESDTGSMEPVTVNLTRDTFALRSRLQNLVEIYNGIVDAIDDHAGYDQATETAGVLIGDSGITLLARRVRTLLTQPLPGYDGSSDTYTMASDIGLEIDRDGHLSLDTETLNEALTDNYFAVLSLVGAVGTGGSSDSAIQFNSASSSTTAGDYEVKVEFDGAGAITSAYMRGEGETEWREATVDGTVITGATGNPEQGLTTTFVWDGVTASPITAEVRVQQGFAGGIYDEMEEMLDPVDGTLALKVERYENAISDLDDRIESWEDRLETREEALREKYARLEANMARLDSMRAAVDALVSSLAQVGGSQKNDS